VGVCEDVRGCKSWASHPVCREFFSVLSGRRHSSIRHGAWHPDLLIPLGSCNANIILLGGSGTNWIRSQEDGSVRKGPGA
jgi:hypothetical protein